MNHMIAQLKQLDAGDLLAGLEGLEGKSCDLIQIRSFRDRENPPGSSHFKVRAYVLTEGEADIRRVRGNVRS
jgi:hypothetical protein